MKNYWKDLEELKILNNSEQEREKGGDKTDISLVGILEDSSDTSRRDFLKLFGFSAFSVSVLSSCKKPITKAIPYLIKPETITPGKADYYASTFYDGNQYASILVKVRDGRPIKIDGNDVSALSAGSSTAIAQASVLELYDENRIKHSHSSKEKATWEEIDAEIEQKLQNIKNKQGNIVLLSSTIISPSTLEVIRRFKKEYPGFQHIMYDSISVSGILDANEKTFGQRLIPGYKFDKANIVVSFGADFLGNWLAPVEFSKAYISKRKLDNGERSLSRHIQVETALSLTGSNADKRIPIKPSEEKLAIATLYKELVILSGSKFETDLPAFNIDFKSIAKELYTNKASSLVVSGSNDSETQILVNAINNLLDSYGNTIDFNAPILTKKGNDTELHQFTKDMHSGNVDGVMFYNCNPAYDYPDRDLFVSGLEKVSLKVAFSGSRDETSVISDYICPDSHYLESWNDANPHKGFYSLGQPVIQTIFDTRQFQDSLLKWSGENIDYLDLIKEFWKNNLYTSNTKHVNFIDFWNQSLQKGVFEISQRNNQSQANFKTDKVSESLNKIKPIIENELEIHLYESNTIGTGKHTNNPWLQETPDAISKVCWDNYAAISPKFAEENELTTGDVILINNTVEIPVLLQPGQKYGSISVALGYGREVIGKAGKDVGTNVYPLVEINEGVKIYHRAITFSKTEKKHEFAMTQTHNSMEGRAIVREASLEDYLENPSAGNEIHEEIEHHLDSLYEKHKYEGHHWGMTVDLNSCIGCNACVVSCTAENNVPVVGKKEVMRVHEMHWIRIDRYYSGDPENPEVSRQPVMCQHCDNAPCENVCPVAATTHSSEGINQMAYNRCIGTRYCNNNCPYKVRRFNWFDYNQADALPGNTMDPAGMSLDLPRMVLNPDVTVRAKGVMEKCSFCIQRIQEKKLLAKLEGRPLADGEIKTACQQACSTNAIVFGDMSDKNSRVTELMKDKRNYHLLEELHTLPSVGYLTKIRNQKG